MDEKKLWQKISGSITFYLSSYDREKSNEELLEDYLFLVLPNDIEDDGIRRYLDKQTFKYVEVSKELEEKAISAFIEIINHSFETSKLWIILAIFTLPIMLLIACIVYIKKYSGYFYIEDDSLILMKHRKTTVTINSIENVRLKRYLRERLKRGVSDKSNKYQFLIKLKNDKNFIPYLITNSVMYEILEPYNVHFLPKDYVEMIKQKD